MRPKVIKVSITDCFICTSLDAITRIKRLGYLSAAYRERLRTERAAARLLQTMDVFFERLILNIRQLEAALDVPYWTAQRYGI